ncbi:MAG: AraC family transcriptional regulator [SAR324 cluster bacterium]|nr:AraC family transcriptional regulator [SAR324 cluster bacterium]
MKKPLEKPMSYVTAAIPLLILNALEKGKIDFQDLSRPLPNKTQKDWTLEDELWLWDEAAQKLNEPHLGLVLSKSVRIGDFGILGYVLSTQKTLVGSLASLSRFHRLIHGKAQIEFVRDHQADRIEHYFKGPFVRTTLGLSSPKISGPGPQASEFTLATLVSQIQDLSGQKIQPQKVHFQRTKPKGVAVYKEYFGEASLIFGQEKNALFFQPYELDQPLKIRPDPKLSTLLLVHAETALNELAQKHPWSQRVTDLGMEALSPGVQNFGVDVNFVASKLGLSSRSLQRRLTEEGTSFRELLQSVKSNLARQYLSDPLINVTEASFLLGYSDPAAFHRAFVKWAGVSPSNYLKTTS